MSASKDKGTKAETAVIKLMREMGWPHVERRSLQGENDRGDVTGIVGVVIEVKAEAKPSFGVYCKEALIEANNDGGSIPIVVWKKPFKNVRKWVSMIPLDYLMGDVPPWGLLPDKTCRWATLDLEDMLWYLKEMGY